MDYAFTFVETQGVAFEKDYAYTGRDGQCKSYTSEFKNSAFTDVPPNSPG